MSDRPRPSLFEELKRRKVWRVATFYAAAAFVVWQVADIALPALGLPETAMTWLVVLAIAGFPIAVGLAWVFELTPEGVKRTSELDAIDPAAEARAPSRPRFIGRASFVATMSLAILAGTWLLVGDLDLLGGDEEISHTALAVFPFDVRGAESLGYLREGMVDLLSRSLDGVGELKSVDPVRVTQLASDDADVRSDGGATLARRIGAGQYVTGSVNEVAGVIRINASLYELRDSIVALARSEVQGDTTELFTLVDRLTAELLAGRPLGAASEGVVRSAAVSTSSLSALKAFLEGEQLLRRAEFDEADEAFARAIDADSSFATAHYRRAVTNGFRGLGRYDIAYASIGEALAHQDRMGPHDRSLALAFDARLHGQLESAVRQYREILTSYPEDLEAKVHLAIVLRERNPFLGEPTTEARELLEEVLEVDPKYQCSLCALRGMAQEERDWDGYERYSKMVHAREEEGDSTLDLDERIVLAKGRGQTAELERLLQAADTVTDDDVRGSFHGLGHSMQVMFGDVELQERFLSASLEGDSDYPEYDYAWEWLVVERTEGHMAKSLEYVRDLGRVERDTHFPLFEAQMPWLLYLDPDVVIPTEQLEEARDLLVGVQPDLLHNHQEWQRPAAEALYEPLRLHYLGLVHARLGSATEAESVARSLDELAAESPDYAVVIDILARTVRAEVAYREGAFATVVDLVGGVDTNGPHELDGYRYPTLAYARVLSTDALMHLGRYREALRWLNYGPFDSPEWVAFQYERRGRAHDAVGDTDTAVADYERFVEAWSDADPAFQPQVEEARRRLAELR